MPQDLNSLLSFFQ